MTAVGSNGICLLLQIVQSHMLRCIALVMSLPVVWLPVVVELYVVVVATKNRSGTIVTAEKQNKDGY